jgi:hypothetical protein
MTERAIFNPDEGDLLMPFIADLANGARKYVEINGCEMPGDMMAAATAFVDAASPVLAIIAVARASMRYYAGPMPDEDTP